MEKFAADMSGLLQETLERYRELKVLLETEKKYVTDMDVQSLWTSTERKKALARAIEDLIRRILGRAKNYTAHSKMDVRSFRVGDVVSDLPLKMEMKSKFKSLGLEIDTIKREIDLLARENKRYIHQYLSVIDGIFATINQRPNENHYSKQGQILAPNEPRRLLHAEV